ncbi:probable thiopurine S-methyltransferase [Diadema antillarum]|uniref:probable thiopurine S-methyltransferase n=1 Tax=Diadema antillarum TaxID=105358 RepID=UPI003A8BC93A
MIISRQGISSLLVNLQVLLRKDMAGLQQWADKWAAGKTTFHRLQVNEALLEFQDKLLVKIPSRVFVPLCGKTVDMKWLADEGHEVVGLEGVEQAIKEFFDEQKLSCKESEVPGLEGGKLYQTEDGKIKLFQCNLFDFSKDVCGQFDAIWDRASLVAVDDSDRQKYTDVVSSLLVPHGRILQEVYLYNPTEMTGNPHSVPPEEIEKLYGEKFKIELLRDAEYLEDNPRFRERGLTWMRQHIRLLTLK